MSRIALPPWWTLAAALAFSACDTAAGPRDAAAPPRDGGGDVLGDPPDGGPAMCMPSAGSFKVTVALEHADCGSRPIIDCSVTDPTYALASELLNIAREACALPNFHWVRVEFESGCPTMLTVQSLAQASVELVDCLTAVLLPQRWRCALPASCAVVEWDTLP